MKNISPATFNDLITSLCEALIKARENNNQTELADLMVTCSVLGDLSINADYKELAIFFEDLENYARDSLHGVP